jgi:hypothetical protein
MRQVGPSVPPFRHPRNAHFVRDGRANPHRAAIGVTPSPSRARRAEQILHRHPSLRHALVVGVAAECLDGGAAFLDAVGVGIGSEVGDDLAGRRRRPWQRQAGAGEVGYAGRCRFRKARARLMVRAFRSGGSFQGNTVISAFGASEAISIETWSGCAVTSSGSTSIGVWHDFA